MTDHPFNPEQDDITRKIIRKAGTAEPSWDFTSRIMNSILAAKTKDVFVYKPVITKTGWLFTGISFAAICIVLMLFPSSPANGPSLIAPYLSPLSAFLDKTATGITGISFTFPAMQGFVGFVVAAWLLFALDRLLRKQKTIQ